MRRLALLILAASSVPACSVPPRGANETGTENGSVVNQATASAPAAGAEPGAEGANASGSAAQSSPEAADVPIKGEAGRPAGPPPPEEEDACGASRYQWLVGRPRSAIPPEPAGATWRIACTGCPITMDYSPRRMNIFYDSETERIDEVRCG